MLSTLGLGQPSMKSKGGVIVKRGQTHPAIETIRERVEERRLAANLSRNEASQRAGLGLSYINDLVLGKSKNPGNDGLVKLAALLDCDVEYFYGNQDIPSKKGGATPLATVAAHDHNVLSVTQIPLYSIGLTDPDGFFALPESRRAPWSLPLDKTASYCVTVPDDTMSPRFKAGEVVIVNPGKPVGHGGFAIIKLVDDRVAIREVVKIAPDMITIRSLSEEAIEELPRAKVKSIDRIIGSCELG